MMDNGWTYLNESGQWVYIPKTPEIDDLAKVYHEICREMINNGIGLITIPTKPYIEWNELTEDQKCGRRFIAWKLLEKYTISEKVVITYKDPVGDANYVL